MSTAAVEVPDLTPEQEQEVYRRHLARITAAKRQRKEQRLHDEMLRLGRSVEQVTDELGRWCPAICPHCGQHMTEPRLITDLDKPSDQLTFESHCHGLRPYCATRLTITV